MKDDIQCMNLPGRTHYKKELSRALLQIEKLKKQRLIMHEALQEIDEPSYGEPSVAYCQEIARGALHDIKLLEKE